MHCVIYRSAKKPGHYLYIEQADEYARVPQALLGLLGKLEEVMVLELNAQRKLAQVDVAQVMLGLQQQGYYLQMPPTFNAEKAIPQ